MVPGAIHPVRPAGRFTSVKRPGLPQGSWDLDALAAALGADGTEVTRSDGDLPGIRRFHTFDPFGNRLEFQQNG